MKHEILNNWWSTKCIFLSKYILSYYFSIHLIMIITLAIVQLRFSIVYNNLCTIDTRIILYLLIIGIIQIIYSFNGILLIIFSVFYNKYSCLMYCLLISLLIHLILFIFLIIWFIIGNYLVFKIKNIVQYTNSYNYRTYCHYSLYQTAFWTLIIYYILTVLFSIVFVCINIKFFIKKFKKPNKDLSEC